MRAVSISCPWKAQFLSRLCKVNSCSYYHQKHSSWTIYSSTPSSYALRSHYSLFLVHDSDFHYLNGTPIACSPLIFEVFHFPTWETFFSTDLCFCHWFGTLLGFLSGLKRGLDFVFCFVIASLLLICSGFDRILMNCCWGLAFLWFLFGGCRSCFRNSRCSRLAPRLRVAVVRRNWLNSWVNFQKLGPRNRFSTSCHEVTSFQNFCILRISDYFLASSIEPKQSFSHQHSPNPIKFPSNHF